MQHSFLCRQIFSNFGDVNIDSLPEEHPSNRNSTVLQYHLSILRKGANELQQKFNETASNNTKEQKRDFSW
jgi:hypothetical protein